MTATIAGLRRAVHQRIAGRRPDDLASLVEGRVARRLPAVVLADVLFLTVLGATAWHSNRADSIDATAGRDLYAGPGSPARRIFAVLTVAGAPGVVTVAAVVVGCWAWWRFRDRLLVAFVPATVLFATGLESVLKRVVARARPSTALVAHLTSHSFPSGHATASTALAMSTMLLVAAARPSRQGAAVFLLAAYACAVCFSRLVLGVHYLTDVIAGAALAGAVTLVTGWFCSRPDDPPTPLGHADTLAE